MLPSCAGSYFQLYLFVSWVEAGGGPAEVEACPGLFGWSWNLAITERQNGLGWKGPGTPSNRSNCSQTHPTWPGTLPIHPSFVGPYRPLFLFGKSVEVRDRVWGQACPVNQGSVYSILDSCRFTTLSSWIQTITGLHKNIFRSFQLEMNHRLNTVVIWKKEAAPFHCTKTPHTFWMLFRTQGAFLDPSLAWQRSLEAFLHLVAGSEGKWLWHCDAGILYPAHGGVRMGSLCLPDPSRCWRGTLRVWNASRALSAGPPAEVGAGHSGVNTSVVFS